MAPNKKTTPNDSTDTRLSILEYKVDEQKTTLDRVEQKIDGTNETLSKLSYVTVKDFTQFKKEVSETYITKDSRKTRDTLTNAVMTALAIAVATAAAQFIFRGGLNQ